MSDRRSLWIPWAIGALACLMLTGAVVLNLVAGGSNPGLVAGSPARLAGTSLTPTHLRVVLELRVLRRLPDEIVVEARLRRADGTPEPAEELDGVLHRATHARDDRPIAFTSQPDRSWQATIRRPDGGAWELAVQARSAAGAASATLRL